MAHRFPCKHETWSNQRNAAREAREARPLVMGPTPHCPWCAREAGAEMAMRVVKGVARSRALDEAKLLAQEFFGSGENDPAQLVLALEALKDAKS